MPQLLYLGHAGFLVQHNGKSMLMDPWFHSAFCQSWFPYPDNRFLLEQVAAKRFDFLYVSHTHEDHFDEALLRTLDRAVTVLCPSYRSRGLELRLRAMGYQNFIVLDHQQSAELAPGIRATMFLDISHKEDSGLMLELDEFRFLNLNDCNTRLEDLPSAVDLLSAQFSGAMWYPNCYDYPAAEMQQKTAKVRNDLLATLFRKCKSLHASCYIPSAGPVCFLDPVLQRFNDREKTIFPQWEDVEAEFQAACPEVEALRMLPGDRLVIANGRKTIQRFAGPRPDSSIDEYANRRTPDWQEYYRGPEPVIQHEEVESYFEELQFNNYQLAENVSKRVRLVTETHAWDIQLGKLAEACSVDSEEPLPPEYTLEMQARLLRRILDGETGWEEALLSMRLKLRRDPDVFDSRFMGLLRYGNQPAQTLQMLREARSQETIERDGFRLQRYCPHAGEDLSEAILCDGVLECPRHHWRWDVRTGKCLEGGSIPLRIERVGPG